MSKISKRKRFDNSLAELVAGVKLSSMTTGGSILSSYGTVSFANNYSLITLNRIILTYLFTGNGIFQTAIQQPILDAMGKGFELESSEMDNEDIDAVLQWWEENKITQLITNFWSWVRLYGGAAIIINTNQDPSEELNLDYLQNSPVEFYTIDRWQLENLNYMKNASDFFTDTEFYFYNGIKIHKSRVIIGKGKQAPSYVNQQLRGWGMSEAERMIRDLNLYLKTQDVLYEILDESKIDVFKIKGLANKLATTGGTSSVRNRIQNANEIKSYVNALVLDLEEDYQQKSLTFAGLAEVTRENRIGVAAALKMPIVKLFGMSASGFSTGESDLENYNSTVESDVRMPLRPVIRKMISIAMASCFGYIPKFNFKFPSLRVLSALDEASVKTQNSNIALALFDRGIMNSYELAQTGRKQGWIEIETEAEKQMIDKFPPPPNGKEGIETIKVTSPSKSSPNTEA